MNEEAKKDEYTLECHNKKCRQFFQVKIADHSAHKRRVSCPHCGKTREYDTRAVLKHNYRKDE